MANSNNSNSDELLRIASDADTATRTTRMNFFGAVGGWVGGRDFATASRVLSSGRGYRPLADEGPPNDLGDLLRLLSLRASLS